MTSFNDNLLFTNIGSTTKRKKKMQCLAGKMLHDV